MDITNSNPKNPQSPQYPTTARKHWGKHWGWILALGIVLVILGIIGISTPVFFTMISIFIFGIILEVSGIVKIIYAFRFWRIKWGAFLLYLFLGLLYFDFGWLVAYKPVESATILTLLVAVFFLASGIFRIATGIAVPLGNHGWIILNGIITFILGILILMQWPGTSYWVIGLFIGIDLIFSGWSLIVYSLTIKQRQSTSVVT